MQAPSVPGTINQKRPVSARIVGLPAGCQAVQNIGLRIVLIYWWRRSSAMSPLAHSILPMIVSYRNISEEEPNALFAPQPSHACSVRVVGIISIPSPPPLTSRSWVIVGSKPRGLWCEVYFSPLLGLRLS
jgi:hypothetical protein